MGAVQQNQEITVLIWWRKQEENHQNAWSVY